MMNFRLDYSNCEYVNIFNSTHAKHNNHINFEAVHYVI